MRKLHEADIERFKVYLQQEERSAATVEKYVRDARSFCAYAGGREISKELTMQYKESDSSYDGQNGGGQNGGQGGGYESSDPYRDFFEGFFGN